MVTKVRLIPQVRVISGPDRSDFQADNVRSMPVMPSELRWPGIGGKLLPALPIFGRLRRS